MRKERPRVGDLVLLDSPKFVDAYRGKVARVVCAKKCQTYIIGEIIPSGEKIFLMPKRGITITTPACI